MLNRLNPLPEASARKNIYTISRLNREVRDQIEQKFTWVWVEGEISNLAKPRSGHIYFSLKDDHAQVRCAMFRTQNMRVKLSLQDGMHVLMKAKVSLYEARGEFQLIAEHIEIAGDGALRQALEVLKQRLDQEGLFQLEHKLPIPALPNKIGVITSPTGAALRDILIVLKRRFPAIPVLIYPTAVQGTNAAEQIAKQIKNASSSKECDILLLARGGGSLEDLWAFNEEVCARAIYNSKIPIITGIGHEIDITIADFVADQRAATPSAAAELVSPDQQEWLQNFEKLENRLNFLVSGVIEHYTTWLTHLCKRVIHPARRIQQQSQRTDEMEQRLIFCMRTQLAQLSNQLSTSTAHLYRVSPHHYLQKLRLQQRNLTQRLITSVEHFLQARQFRLSSATRALDAVNPLATLGRGYTILYKLPKKQVICDAKTTQPGDKIEARMRNGRLHCKVEKVFTH